MKWSHLLAASTPVIGLPFIVSEPAHASAMVVLGLPLVPVAALTIQTPAASTCAISSTTSFPTESAYVSPKSAAILGGAPSKLELVSLQQSGGQSNALMGKKVEPAAGGLRCQQFALTWSPAPITGSGIRPRTNPQDFLGSARLPLRRTNLDAQWNSVRRSGLSPRALSPLAARMTGKPDKAMLASVNAWSNARIRYEEDRDLYGKADHWATAGATLRRGAGDCEDIAILKMQALAALGVPRADMYLTIARDMVRNADHALLVVKLEDRHWVLDNATDTLLDASESHDYRPIMSFSTSGKWLHGYELPASRLLAAR